MGMQACAFEEHKVATLDSSPSASTAASFHSKRGDGWGNDEVSDCTSPASHGDRSMSDGSSSFQTRVDFPDRSRTGRKTKCSASGAAQRSRPSPNDMGVLGTLATKQWRLPAVDVAATRRPRHPETEKLSHRDSQRGPPASSPLATSPAMYTRAVPPAWTARKSSSPESWPDTSRSVMSTEPGLTLGWPWSAQAQAHAQGSREFLPARVWCTDHTDSSGCPSDLPLKVDIDSLVSIGPQTRAQAPPSSSYLVACVV